MWLLCNYLDISWHNAAVCNSRDVKKIKNRELAAANQVLYPHEPFATFALSRVYFSASLGA